MKLANISNEPLSIKQNVSTLEASNPTHYCISNILFKKITFAENRKGEMINTLCETFRERAKIKSLEYTLSQQKPHKM